VDHHDGAEAHEVGENSLGRKRHEAELLGDGIHAGLVRTRRGITLMPVSHFGLKLRVVLVAPRPLSEIKHRGV
jgi:hypothetical protein